jgi:hypothetical protein
MKIPPSVAKYDFMANLRGRQQQDALRSADKMPDIFVRFLTKSEVSRQTVTEVASINFHGNSSAWCRAGTCGQAGRKADGMVDMTKLTDNYTCTPKYGTYNVSCMSRQKLLGDTVKVETSGACGIQVYKGEEKCVHNFGGEA